MEAEIPQEVKESLKMIIHPMAVGPLQANCYIVGCPDTRQAVVIDPGGDGDRILAVVEAERLSVTGIVNTHGHFDHVGANKHVKSATGVDLMIHSLDAPMLKHMAQTAAAWGLRADESPAPDRLLEDGDSVMCGNIEFKVIHTPGHSPGGISLHADNAVFVGDSLFAGSIGRTDLPGGSYDTLIQSIQTRLFSLPDDVVVYAGHMDTSTIGREKRTNPFCRMK
jgi:glyoxylase-like metal-dependent hydrolase (beta-lactamase superfamily II)